MATATMNKLTATERAANTVSSRKTRLEATKARTTRQRQNANDATNRARLALEKAQARVQACEEKERLVNDRADALLRKQGEELFEAMQRHEQAKEREAAKVAKANARADRELSREVAATVETETGERYDLGEGVVEVIKDLVGRKRSGVFAPIDGAEAVAILEAVENKNYDLGDIFSVSIKGRKTVIVFSVEAQGLAFEVETKK